MTKFCFLHQPNLSESINLHSPWNQGESKLIKSLIISALILEAKINCQKTWTADSSRQNKYDNVKKSQRNAMTAFSHFLPYMNLKRS